MSEGSPRYFTELSLEAIESQSNVVPPETTAEAIQQEADKAMGEPSDLPF